MTEYCTATDVSNRLKAAGYSNVIDEDQDSIVDAAEIAASITPQIENAGSIMDEYFVNRIEPYVPATLRAGNTWCKYCCVDIACWYIVANGGRDIPESLQTAYDNRIARLEGIENGNLIPGTTDPGTPLSDKAVAPFEIISVGATP